VKPAVAVPEPPVLVERRGAVARLTLNRPDRHNALVPDLVHGLRDAVLGLEAMAPAAVVLAGAGRSFSTGGDVAGFLAQAERSRAALVDYAQALVGGLHDTILALLHLEVPVIARVQGAVTGGSAGLVLAADLVAMAEDAFLQPWYAAVGFGPDGGWTALVPERVGTGRAMAVQALNQRIGAAEAVGLGLATAVVAAADLDATVDGWADEIVARSGPSLAAARRGIWDEERIGAVRRRLEGERERFVALIDRPETIAGMRRFVARTRAG
jgi:2-(1,2-epoxy-1,2-dihydrophenyl)acetyl-CoA isomerase